MSYADVAAMVEDWELRMRLIACAAQEQHEAPLAFVEEHIWRICAQPGWHEAWAKVSDAAANDEDYKPGADESVLPDALIQAGVRKVIQDLAVKAVAQARSVEDGNSARIQAEDEREFARHVRLRRWEMENAQPNIVKYRPYDVPPPDPDE